MSNREVSLIRDGMRMDWDVPIEMDDGLVLRADIYRPIEEGRYPILMTYGPYGKWLHFQDGYDTAWDRMVAQHPDVPAGSTNTYQNWEVVDPEKWVADGYVCVRVDSRGCGRSPGYIELWSPREAQDFARCIEWAGGGRHPPESTARREETGLPGSGELEHSEGDCGAPSLDPNPLERLRPGIALV